MKRKAEGEQYKELPIELWLEIGQYLEIEDCIRMTSISSLFYPLLPEMIQSLDSGYTGGSSSYLSIDNETLKRLYKLEILELENSKSITNEGLLTLTRLQMLDLHGNMKITNDGIRHLTSLTYLKLGNNFQITGEALLGMKNLTYLDLDLYYPDDSDDSVDFSQEAIHPVDNQTLSSLPSLTYLNLTSNNAITLEGLLGVKNLKVLHLSGDHQISDRDLAKLSTLEVLELTHDFNILGDYAHEMTNLRELRLFHHTLFRKKNVAKLTSLTYLDLLRSGFAISDNILSGLTNLTHLNIGYNVPEITDASITKLTKLNTLIIGHQSQLKMEIFQKLPLLTNLCALCSCPDCSSEEED